MNERLIRNPLACGIAVLLTMAIVASPVLADYYYNIVIDGNPWADPDWLPSAATDKAFDVAPEQVGSIDLQGYSSKVGHIRPTTAAGVDSLRRLIQERGGGPSDIVEFVFWLQFVEPVFQDSVESRVDLLFDVKPDRAFGQVMDQWTNLRPDGRVSIFGRNGRITQVTRDVWDGNQWVNTAKGLTVPGVKLAFMDVFIEGDITYEALGSPRANDAREMYFGWAVVTTQGDNHDYVPKTVDGKAPFNVFTAVEPSTWGQVKDGHP